MQMKLFEGSQAFVPKDKNLQILPHDNLMAFTGQQLSVPGLFECKYM